MSHRTLHRKVCPCGQPFTTSDADAVYHSKECSARFRVARDGMPANTRWRSVDKLKEFRRA